MCWCVCVTMLWIDCGGCEWNTIRNILIANTDVENSKKLLVFILSAHYHTLHSTPNIVSTTLTLIKRSGALTDQVKSFSKLFSHKIKEININDTGHRKTHTRPTLKYRHAHTNFNSILYRTHDILFTRIPLFNYFMLSYICIRKSNRSERKSVRLSSLPLFDSCQYLFQCCCLFIFKHLSTIFL